MGLADVPGDYLDYYSYIEEDGEREDFKVRIGLADVPGDYYDYVEDDV